jgi:paraquat-inducible protein B
MSKPANKKVIGAFVLGAIGLLVVALLIFGSGKIFKKTVPVVFYFEGSVKGLNIGSQVVIRGVPVGAVTDIVLQYSPQDMSVRVPVYAEFDPDKVVRVGGEKYEEAERAGAWKRLIERGLRGQLQMQSLLTGLLMINLDFLPDTPLRLVGKDPSQLEIPTVPTPMEELSKRIEKIPFEEIFDKLASSLRGIDKVVNSPEMEGSMKALAQSLDETRKLIKSINDEMKPLIAGIHDTVKDTRSFIKNADTQMQGVASRLEGVLGDAQKLVQNVDRQVGTLASQFESTLGGAKKLVGDVNAEVGSITSDLRKTLEEVRAALAQVQKTLQAAEGNYAEGSAFYYDLNETLEGLNKVSRSIQLLVEYLKQHPDVVIWGKGKSGGK